MIALICFVLAVLASPFKSNIRLGAENAVLRHQLIVLRRKLKGRARLTNNDRWFFVQLYRWFPSILPVLMIIRPETLVGWHRAGFRRYWRWKSCRRGGRPQIETELRALIRQMSTENLLWGAPRIHGELLNAEQTRRLVQIKPWLAPIWRRPKDRDLMMRPERGDPLPCPAIAVAGHQAVTVEDGGNAALESRNCDGAPKRTSHPAAALP